ncbi:MAG: hypothetical protein J7L91_05335 [Candidatus Korarchaeota archaeon]|nr:hypothetical protein [Candidatus Korarchaeota archaeon]
MYLYRIALILNTKIGKPWLSNELEEFGESLSSFLSVDLVNPLISLIPADRAFSSLVLIFSSREIPELSLAMGSELALKGRKARIVDAKAIITDVEVARSEATSWSERCASLELVTPYPFDGPSIPPIRGVLGSALDVWKSYTGEELRLGRAKVLRQDLKVIKTKEWRGLVGTLTVKGRGAGTAAYIAGLVGLGKWRSKGFGLANFLGDKGCERFERSENR